MSCLRKRDHHEDVNLRTSNEYTLELSLGQSGFHSVKDGLCRAGLSVLETIVNLCALCRKGRSSA